LPTLAILVLCSWLAPTRALAYVDPGSGSILIQVVIAAVVGIGVTVKMYWRKIKAILPFARRGDRQETDD
jgi:hypothetical protein